VFPMRRLLVIACGGAALLAAAPAEAATRTVKIGDDWFVRDAAPTTVTVAKGTRVRWRWTGRDEHNVSVRRGPARFRSDFKRSGTFGRTLRRRGTYRIVCEIHQPDMRMTLKVR
jgi:plastocyanin